MTCQKLFSGLLFSFLTFIIYVESSVRILEVHKELFVTNPAVEVLSTVTYKNDGNEVVNTIYFSFDAKFMRNISLLSYREATSSDIINVKLCETNFVKLKGSSSNMIRVPIKLYGSLSQGETLKIGFREVYTNLLHPFPEKIKQLEPNRVVIEYNVYFLSEYVVETQKFTIKYSNSVLEKIDDVDMFVKKSNFAVFEHSSPVSPNSEKLAKFHLILHFHTVSHAILDRKIFISEYGKLKFVDSHVFINQAANLTGEYSRFHESTNNLPPHVVHEFSFYLPLSATNIKYTDFIGNISTSTILEQDENLLLVIGPRFYLYGGWNTEFTISYTVPVDEFLTIKDGTRTLSTTFLGDFRGAFPVESYKLEVIFPENAKYITANIPDWISYEKSHGRFFYYLDYFGRPTCVVSAKNLVFFHNEQITFMYDHDTIMLLLKPILLSGIIGGILVLLTIFSRLNLFGGKKHDQTEVFLFNLSKFKLKLKDLCAILKDHQLVIALCFKDKDVKTLEELHGAFKSKFDSEKDALKKFSEILEENIPSLTICNEKIKPKLEFTYQCVETQIEVACNLAKATDKRKVETEFATAKKKFNSTIVELEKLVSSL